MPLQNFNARYGKQLQDYGKKTSRRRASKSQSRPNLSFPINLFSFRVFGKHEKVKSFHETLAPVILLGNIFSIFPISGIFAKSIESLKFRLLYPVAIYTMILQLCFMVELVLLFLFLSKTGLKFFIVGEFENYFNY